MSQSRVELASWGFGTQDITETMRWLRTVKKFTLESPLKQLGLLGTGFRAVGYIHLGPFRRLIGIPMRNLELERSVNEAGAADGRPEFHIQNEPTPTAASRGL